MNTNTHYTLRILQEDDYKHGVVAWTWGYHRKKNIYSICTEEIKYLQKQNKTMIIIIIIIIMIISM